MSSPNAHKFTCEMDLARTYLRHGKLATALAAAEAAWGAAFELGDDGLMVEASYMLSDIRDAAHAY